MRCQNKRHNGETSNSLYAVQCQVGLWGGPLTTSMYWSRAVPPLTWRKLLSCIRQSRMEVVGSVSLRQRRETLTIGGGLRGTSHYGQRKGIGSGNCVRVGRETQGRMGNEGREDDRNPIYIAASCGVEHRGIRISDTNLQDTSGQMWKFPRILERISDLNKPQSESKIRVEPLHRRNIRLSVACGGSVRRPSRTPDKSTPQVSKQNISGSSQR